jgi:threonine synthase
VTDEEILAAKAIIDRAGIGCEPASAATLAGAKKLVERGIIRRDEKVVGILTGHLLKDSHTGIPQTISGQVIQPNLAAVKQALQLA